MAEYFSDLTNNYLYCDINYEAIFPKKILEDSSSEKPKE